MIERRRGSISQRGTSRDMSQPTKEAGEYRGESPTVPRTTRGSRTEGGERSDADRRAAGRRAEHRKGAIRRHFSLITPKNGEPPSGADGSGAKRSGAGGGLARRGRAERSEGRHHGRGAGAPKMQGAPWGGRERREAERGGRGLRPKRLRRAKRGASRTGAAGAERRLGEWIGGRPAQGAKRRRAGRTNREPAATRHAGAFPETRRLQFNITPIMIKAAGGRRATAPKPEGAFIIIVVMMNSVSQPRDPGSREM